MVGSRAGTPGQKAAAAREKAAAESSGASGGSSGGASGGPDGSDSAGCLKK